MNDLERLRAIGDWLGTPWTPLQERLLLRYAEYLRDEGIKSGGLGPHEAPRMIDRHVGDSLVYLSAVGQDVSTLLDVGAGIGLPGIPIAIARPDLDVVLLDRSQRRCDLAGRATRILGVVNISVRQGDVNATKGSWDIVTFRASLGIEESAVVTRRLTRQDGIGVFGVSRLTEVPDLPEPPEGIEFDLRKEADEILDSPSWLLRMSHL